MTEAARRDDGGMIVTIVGGHGQIALLLAERLSAAGHSVRSTIRKEEHEADVRAAGGEPVRVDLEDPLSDLDAAVEGADAVVFVAGAGPGSSVERKESMDYGGAVKLIEAAEGRGVNRYLILSSTGADDPEAREEAMRPYLSAKGRADERLRESSLDYTIIRPGRLTDDEGNGLITAAESLGRRGEIPRQDVAATFVAVLENRNTVGKTFEVLSGDTSIEEALKSL